MTGFGCVCGCPVVYVCDSRQVRLVCPGVFAASIALAAPGRLDPVRLCVDSFDKASSIDAWASSKHQVRGKANYCLAAASHIGQCLQ